MGKQYLSFPERLLDNVFETVQFRLTRRNQRSQNEFTGEVRDSDPTDVRFLANLTSAPIQEEYWAEIMAFVDLLQGTSGYCTLYDPLYYRPLGVTTGTTQVTKRIGRTYSDGTRHTDGTFAMATSTMGRIRTNQPYGSQQVEIAGLMADQAKSIVRGDRLTILHGFRKVPTLYYAARDAASNASGAATVSIQPGLRYPVRIGDLVDFWKPRGIFKLTREPEFPVTAPENAVVALDFIESLDILEDAEIPREYAA